MAILLFLVVQSLLKVGRGRESKWEGEGIMGGMWTAEVLTGAEVTASQGKARATQPDMLSPQPQNPHRKRDTGSYSISTVRWEARWETPQEARGPTRLEYTERKPAPNKVEGEDCYPRLSSNLRTHALAHTSTHR